MLTELSAAELARLLKSRGVSAVEIVQAYLSRIRAHDSSLGCFLTVDEESAHTQAEEAQKKLDRGEAGPLAGVPIALKDNLSTKGLRTTCASKILENYVPPYDATVVSHLRAQGMPILGKTNLDEFAMGTSTENSAYQLTRNPWDLNRSPGGSSGGSAAAVAAGLAPLSLGSDTGGSIRQPAALCGVVGFKPTYGRCSRFGLVAFASSLDQIGPMSRTVEDAALCSSAITGHDPLDSTSLPDSRIRIENLKGCALKGLRVALPKELFGETTDPRVLETVYAAIETLRRQGVEFTEISLPTILLGVTTYYIIAPAEASSNLARFDGVRYGPRVEGDGHIGATAATRGKLFGHEVKARIMIGTYALSAGYYDAYYVRAQAARRQMTYEIEQAFAEFDCVLSPTSPIPAFKIGELSTDPMALKSLDLCTIPANMGGFPAISLNCGFADGLPIGVQLMGALNDDERLLQMAFAVEQSLPDAAGAPTIP